jgi:peroxiredoxin
MENNMKNWNSPPDVVPNVVFKTRVRDESIGGPNPYTWKDVTTQEIFAGKKVVLFALPGAFTPTCSSTHLPRYEELFEEFKAQGVDQIICLSVNDAFVMFQWGKQQGAKNVFLLPDGSGEFSRKMGMLVDKSNIGFGMRSWRYAMVVNNGEIEKMFIEPGFEDNCGRAQPGCSHCLLQHSFTDCHGRRGIRRLHNRGQ